MAFYLLFLLLAVFVRDSLGGHWSVSSGDVTCIVLDANATGIVKYEKDDNKTADFEFSFTTGAEPFTSGSCALKKETETLQNVEINFYPFDRKPKLESEKNQTWTLTLTFAKGKENAFVLQDFALHAYFYSSLMLNTSEVEHTYTKGDQAATEVAAEGTNAFRCLDTGLSFTGGSTVNLKNMKVIAFAHLNSTNFPPEQTFAQCSFDARTSDVVPIVVGACLAVLVIVVLIAYLIGRARAKRQGYASV